MGYLNAGLMEVLSEDQVTALKAMGNVVVIGPPGSGKSHLIRHKYQQALDLGISPQSIAVVTFTRYAAERLLEILNENQPLPGYIGTTTGWAWRIIQSVDPDAQVITDMEIEKAKDWYSSITRYSDDGFQEYLRRNHYVYLGDIIPYTTQLLKQHPRLQEQVYWQNRLIIWDEFQDSTPEEFELLQTVNPGQVFLLGDPNQAIYSFRGADRRVLYHAIDTFQAEVIRLSVQHRIRQPVTEILDTPDFVPRLSEVSKEYRSIGILTRYNRDAEVLQKYLESKGFSVRRLSTRDDPYSGHDWERAYWLAKLATLPHSKRPVWMQNQNVVETPVNHLPPDTPISRIIPDQDLLSVLPPRIRTLQDFVQWYPTRSVKDQLAALGDTGIHIMTIHASKGLEFDVVFLFGAPTQMTLSRLQGWMHLDPIEGLPQEEDRVWYVGFTRARYKRFVFTLSNENRKFLWEKRRLLWDR